MSSLSLALAVPGEGFRPDLRFLGKLAGEAAPRKPDPAEGAYAEGYAKGFEEGSAQEHAKAERDTEARGRLELGFGRLAESEQQRIEQRLRETVLTLCEQTLAPLALDPDVLAVRVSKALEMLRRGEDERLLRLHPDDLALVADRLPERLKVEVDPNLERGELRVETREGGVEDGPEQWRRALTEVLGL